MSRHQNLAPLAAAWQRRPRSARRALSPGAVYRFVGGIVGPDRASGGARGGTARGLGSADELRGSRADHRVERE